LFNFIFIPLYSYQAAAWGSVLTESLVSCLMLVFIWKNLSFFPSFKTGIKSLLAAAAMASLLWFWREGNLFLRMAAGVVIYFPILYLIRGFSYQEISQILKGEDVVATP
jgi:O-antigen/teichoic acid export membrane protein